MATRKTFWVVLILLVAGWIGYHFSAAGIYIRLVYLLLLFLVINWALAWYALKQIDVQRSSREARQQVGQIFEERFKVTNRSRLGKLWIEVRDESSLNPQKSSKVLSWVNGHRYRSYGVFTMLTQRGHFNLGPTVLRSGDPFGMFMVERSIASAHELLVLPYTVKLLSFPFPPGALMGGRVVRRKTQIVTPYAAGVREYAPGDSLSRIHWKSTARRHHLMVKEFDQDSQSVVWVLLDACQTINYRIADVKSGKESQNIWLWEQRNTFRLPSSAFEYGVSAAASISSYFIHIGQAVGFASAGQVFTSLTSERGERQLGKIMEILALLRCEGNLPLLGLINSQTAGLPRGSTVVVITAAMNQGTLLAAEELLFRNMRPVFVLLQPDSFGGTEPVDQVVFTLLERGVPVLVLKNGEDLKTSLENPL